MKERPILFSAPMVRAILEGRKTQTRRVVKLNDAGRVARGGRQWHIDDDHAALACPYGQPGDRLWVREAHLLDPPIDGTWPSVGDSFTSIDDIPERYRNPEHVLYRADDKLTTAWRWRPSIHMPRWASRITLEVTDVRVERLQDISEADAQAEGVDRDTEPCDHTRRSCADVGCLGPTHRAAFCDLWMQINGADSWAANPWVWVVSFRRLEA